MDLHFVAFYLLLQNKNCKPLKQRNADLFHCFSLVYLEICWPSQNAIKCGSIFCCPLPEQGFSVFIGLKTTMYAIHREVVALYCHGNFEYFEEKRH